MIRFLRCNYSDKRGFACIVKKLPNGGSDIASQHVRLLTIPQGLVAGKYVIKLSHLVSNPDLDIHQEACIYKVLASEPEVVTIVSSGNTLIRKSKRFIIHIKRHPVMIPASFATELCRLYDSRKVKIVYVVTVYEPHIVPVTRVGQKHLNYFVDNAITTLKRLHAKYLFCHWDFHGHNQMIDCTTGRLCIVDLDRSTTKQYPISMLWKYMPIDMLAIFWNKERLPYEYLPIIGHHFDICKLFTSNPNYKGKYTGLHKKYINAKLKAKQVMYDGMATDLFHWMIQRMNVKTTKKYFDQYKYCFNDLIIAALLVKSLQNESVPATTEENVKCS